MSKPLNWNRAASHGDVSPAVEAALLEGLRADPPCRGGNDEGADRLLAARVRLARYFGLFDPKRVIFTPGATSALNQAIFGCIRAGQRVLSTRLEHNAVLRPLEVLRRRGNEVRYLGFDASGRLRLDELEGELDSFRPDWMVVGLASNVLGTLQPLAEIAARCRHAGANVIADLAQGAGQVPIALQEWGIDAAAVPGHKGMAGPRGIGALLLGPDAEPEPLLFGGTGVQGHLRLMPVELPLRLEAGTPNLPGIYALDAAVRQLEERPIDLEPVRRRLRALEDELRADPDWGVLPTESPPWSERLPILALAPPQLPASTLAGMLAQLGIQTRAGLQCAPDACSALGYRGGILRLSPPPDANDDDFERVRQALYQAREALV